MSGGPAGGAGLGRTGSGEHSVGVINPVPFVERDGRFFMNPDETHALSCWTDHFRRTLLFKPRLRVDALPDGWVALPGNVAAEPLYEMSREHIPSHLARRRGTREAVRRRLPELGLAYLRAPNWECSWAEDLFAGAGLPLLVELFGDWESSLYTEWESHPAKRLLRGPVSRWCHRLTARQARRADLLGCMGEALRDKYAEGRRAWITTAHLVPERRFLRRDDTCREEAPRLLFVGILSWRKGLRHLIDAVRILRDEGRAVALDLVGGGPQREELERRVAESALGDRVTFHGHVAHGERLLGFFRRADVFVLPSVGAEGVPRVIQEALASSCPVVACDVGSVRYQLRHGECGVVVPPGDARALADAVARVTGDGEFRRALIAAGYEEALRHSFGRQWHEIGELLREHLDPALLSGAREPLDPP